MWPLNSYWHKMFTPEEIRKGKSVISDTANNLSSKMRQRTPNRHFGAFLLATKVGNHEVKSN